MRRRLFVLLCCVALAVNADAAKIKGYIWDVTADGLVVEGQAVQLPPSVKVERKNQRDVTVADLRIGWEVEVEGDQRAGGFVAKKVKVKNKRHEDVDIHGFVETVSDRTINVEGRELFWPTDAVRPAIRPGMRVDGEGILLDDGSVQLEKVKVGPRGFNEDEAQFMMAMRQDVAKFKESIDPIDEQGLIEYVTTVGEGLVPEWVDPNELGFNFSVIDDPSLNAFALPDGTVVVHTGLLAVLENEAQLATVLGHEIAHATHRHGYRGYKNQKKMSWLKIGAIAGGIAVGAATDKGWAGALAGLGGGLAVSAVVSGHGRGLEDEADRVGLHYMVDAGYDPYQAPEVWHVFSRYTADQNAVQNFFFSDHSTHQARISNLTREINQHYRESVSPGTLAANQAQYESAVAPIRKRVAAMNYQRKEYANAAKAFAAELERDPDDPISLYFKGKILWDTGGAERADDAIAAFRQAAASDPEFPEPYREIGGIYYRLERHRDAAEAFEVYLEMRPDAPSAAQIRNYLASVPR